MIHLPWVHLIYVSPLKTNYYFLSTTKAPSTHHHRPLTVSQSWGVFSLLNLRDLLRMPRGLLLPSHYIVLLRGCGPADGGCLLYANIWTPFTHLPSLLEDPFCTVQMTSGSHPAIAANGCKDSLRPEVDLFLTVPY